MRSLAAVLLLILAFPAFAADREPTVTLDVEDAGAREILKSMQTQCGIKNLIIDPDVNGSGSFFFREVPCRQAFRVVLRTLGLQMSAYSQDLVNVEPKAR